MPPDLYPYIVMSRAIYGPIRYPAIFPDYMVGTARCFSLGVAIQVSPAYKVGQVQSLSLTPPQISMSYTVA